MAGSSSAASKCNRSMSQSSALQIPFHRMFSIKPQHIKRSRYKIKTGCRCFFNRHLICSDIFDHNASGYDICFFQHAIQQMYLHLCLFICQNDFQCLCFFFPGINRRKSLQGIFSFSDFITLIEQIHALHAFCIFYIQRNIAIIPGSKRRILLWQRIQRIGAIHARCIRISGKSAVCIG